MKYGLKKYDDRWPILFKEEKDSLIEKLKPFKIEGIEHIGATSVLLCKTAGTIDIMVALQSKMDLLSVKNYLCKNGYEEIPHLNKRNCLFLVRRNKSKQIVSTLRLVEYASDEYIKIVSFKQYLKGHKKYRNKYNEFRKTLLEQEDMTMFKYNQIKANYICSKLEENFEYKKA